MKDFKPVNLGHILGWAIECRLGDYRTEIGSFRTKKDTEFAITIVSNRDIKQRLSSTCYEISHLLSQGKSYEEVKAHFALKVLGS